MSRRPPGGPTSIPAGPWSDLWRELVKQLGAPTAIALRLVEHLVLNLMAANAALAEARQQPIVTGSKGQEVEHPGFKVASRCEDRATAIARQLRLTLGANSSGSDQDDGPAPSAFDDLDELPDEVAQARARRRQA